MEVIIIPGGDVYVPLCASELNGALNFDKGASGPSHNDRGWKKKKKIKIMKISQIDVWPVPTPGGEVLSQVGKHF